MWLGGLGVGSLLVWLSVPADYDDWFSEVTGGGDSRISDGAGDRTDSIYMKFINGYI